MVTEAAMSTYETIRNADDSDEVDDGVPTFPDYAHRPAPSCASEVKYRGGVTTHFPALVHAMLSLAEADGYGDVCRWSAHGRSFAVYDRNRFVGKVMPLYFRQTQFPSFQRQLNLYGFRRLCQQASPEAVGSYYHPMFLRGRQDLCPAILRQTEKELREMKKSGKKTATKSEDPDFTSMEPIPQISKEHIEMARSITIPQRKGSVASGTRELVRAAVCGGITEAFTTPGKWPKELFEASSLLEDKAVNHAYSSLFLNNDTEENKLDLSWMEPTPIALEVAPYVVEPTPIAPEVASVVHTEPNFISDQSVTDSLFGNIGSPDTACSASVLSSYPARGPNALGKSNQFQNDENFSINQPKEHGTVRCMKRGRTSGSFRHRSSFCPPKMDSFLEEFGLDFSDSDDLFSPQDRRQKPSPHPENHVPVCNIEPDDTVARAMPQLLPYQPLPPGRVSSCPTNPKVDHSRSSCESDDKGSCRMPQMLPYLSMYSCPSKPNVDLPRTFEQIANFPRNEALVITRAELPFTIISANAYTERVLEQTRAEILEKPLLSYCVEKSDRAKLNATIFALMASSQDEEVLVNLQLGNGGNALFRAKGGPFFLACDPNEVHGIQHISWHLQPL